jgi:hypothetical protein
MLSVVLLPLKPWHSMNSRLPYFILHLLILSLSGLSSPVFGQAFSDQMYRVVPGGEDAPTQPAILGVSYFGIRRNLNVPAATGINTSVNETRRGDLWGGVVSHRVNPDTFLSLQFARGDSRGSFTETYANAATFGTFNGTLFEHTIKGEEKWLEICLRQNLNSFREKSVMTFWSGGFTYIDDESEIFSDITFPVTGIASLNGLRTKSSTTDSFFVHLGGGIAWHKDTDKLAYGLRGDVNALLGREKTETSTHATTGSVLSSTSSRERIAGVLGGTTAYTQLFLNKSVRVNLEGGLRGYYWNLDQGDQFIFGPVIRTGIDLSF